MTFRTVMLTSALAGSMAFAASAETQSEELGNTNKGQSLAATSAADTEAALDLDVRGFKGENFVTVGIENRTEADSVDGFDKDQSVGVPAADNAENTLAAAEPGTPVRAFNGEKIGTVAYIAETGELGDTVFVNIAPESGLPAELVGIDLGSLKVMPSNEAIEWVSTMDVLERAIIDALSS